VWFIEVLFIQAEYLWDGVLIFIDHTYDIALYIILENESFENEVSDNGWAYFWVNILWPFYMFGWVWVYLFPTW